MTEIPTIGLGIIGLGYIGKIHAQACRSIPLCFAKPQAIGRINSVLRSHPDGDEELLDSLGSPTVTTDLDAFLSQDIDVVDICSPNNLHEEEVLAAAKAGKHIYCEKPLGRNLAEVQRMTKAANEAHVFTHGAFVLRYVPAINQMKQLIDSGAIGTPLHFRGVMYHGSYLNPNRPMSWRLRKADSGSGAWLDLGAHMVDLCRYLMGDIETVQAQLRTFISQRPVKAGSSEMATVDVDDWCLCQMEMQNGASGSVEVSRVAGGTGEDTKLEIYGSKGAVRYDVMKPETASFFDLKTGEWVQGRTEGPVTVNGRPLADVWPNGKFTHGMLINAHLASMYDFFLNIKEGKQSMLAFEEGLVNQAVMEAAMVSSDRQGARVDVQEYMKVSLDG